VEEVIGITGSTGQYIGRDPSRELDGTCPITTSKMAGEAPPAPLKGGMRVINAAQYS